MKAVHATGEWTEGASGRFQLAMTPAYEADDSLGIPENPSPKPAYIEGEPPSNGFYPLGLTRKQYHLFCFLHRRLKFRENGVRVRSVSDPTDETVLRFNSFPRHIGSADTTPQFVQMPDDERRLLHFPGCCFVGETNGAGEQVIYPPLLQQGFNAADHNWFVACIIGWCAPSQIGVDTVDGVTWPVKIYDTDYATLYPSNQPVSWGNAAVYFHDGKVWPRIKIEFSPYPGVMWTTIPLPQPDYPQTFATVAESIRLDVLGWGTIPLYRSVLLGGTLDNGERDTLLQLVSPVDGLLHLDVAKYYPYRDADGLNPTWDEDTGAQLIRPIPQTTS